MSNPHHKMRYQPYPPNPRFQPPNNQERTGGKGRQARGVGQNKGKNT